MGVTGNAGALRAAMADRDNLDRLNELIGVDEDADCEPNAAFGLGAVGR